MSQQEKPKAEPIKYGDVFHVSGQLASQSIPPGDGSIVQSDDAITIGEALEVTTMSAGDKVVDQSDAAAIQAAEARATGSNTVTPGGVAAMAQSAVALNERIVAEDHKITLSDVLTVMRNISINLVVFFYYKIFV